MCRLQLVVYPLRDILPRREQVGFMLGEEEAMFRPELTYETNQSSSERANGGGRRTITLHVTPVNLSAHGVVVSCILRMCQAVSSKRTSPVPLVPISGSRESRLSKILAYVLYQVAAHSRRREEPQYLSLAPTARRRHHFCLGGPLHRKLDLQRVGSGNAHMTNQSCRVEK
jgi:hypothetical protein